MANNRETYAGKYLTAADVKGKPFTGIVESTALEKMNDGRERVCVYFENRKRPLVLNKTRYDAVVAITKSYEEDDWLGTQLLVDTGKTKNPQGQTVDCIVVSNGRVKTAGQKRHEVKAALGGDDIPPEGDPMPKNMQPAEDEDDDF